MPKHAEEDVPPLLARMVNAVLKTVVEDDGVPVSAVALGLTP